MRIIERLGGSAQLLTSLSIIVVVVATAILTTIGLRVGLRYLMRRAVHRAWQGQGRWVARLPRRHDGSRAVQRRLQRADAAAHMVHRLASMVIAGFTLLLVTALVGVDPVVLVSSAGFVGAGIAVGGQSIIKDWLTGLLVLLEDRYAIGDRTTMRVGDDDIVGIVESLHGAGLRLRLPDGATWHIGHGAIDSVINHSQQLVSQRIDVPLEVWDQLDPASIGHALSAASHDVGLTDVVLVADVSGEGHQEAGGVTIQASRPLNRRQQEIVSARISELSQT